MIRCRNIGYRYPNGQGIRHIDVDIPARSVYLLAGDNGSGKSTFLKVLAGGLRAQEGSIDYEYTSAEGYDRRFNFALSPQNPEAQFSLSSVSDELRFTARVAGLAVDNEKEDAITGILGLRHCFDKSPFDLSTLERKLLSLAIAALIPAPCVAFDEPTAGIDTIRRKSVISLIEYVRAFKTVIIVTHETDAFLSLCTHIGIMREGTFIESTGTGEFLRNVTRNKYPREILRNFLIPRMSLFLTGSAAGSIRQIREQLEKRTNTRNNNNG